MDKLEIPQAVRHAWHTPIIPTLESQSQEDLKSNTRLLYKTLSQKAKYRHLRASSAAGHRLSRIERSAANTL